MHRVYLFKGFLNVNLSWNYFNPEVDCDEID